jgi:hypothetical protein
MYPSSAATGALRGAVRGAMLLESGLASCWEWPGVEVEDFLCAVRRQRLTELLATHASALDLPQGATQALSRERDSARMGGLLLTRELGRLATLFSETNIPFLVFKGQALAKQSTGDTFARGNGDLDILIAPSSLAAAVEVLEAHEWSAAYDYPRAVDSWSWRHQLSTSWEMTFVGPHSYVDLHWRLGPTHRELPDFETAWRRRRLVDLGTVTVDSLALPDAFAHTCSHAAKDDWRWLRSIVDVHRLARQLSTSGLDVALRPVDLMTLAVTDACIGLPPDVPASVLERSRATSRRLVSRGLRAQDREVPRVGQHVHGAGLPQAALGSLRGNRAPDEVVRVVLGLLLPGRGLGKVTDRRAVTGMPKAGLLRARTAAGLLWEWSRRNRRAVTRQR